MIALLAALMVVAMPSGASLWIDEAATARLASKPTLAAWSQEMLHGQSSEHQMPLSMFLAWVGGRTLGTSEWQLRAVNIVWGLAAVAALFFIGRRVKLPWLPGLLAIHPFFVAYMNEARPYAMQIGAGAWLLYAMIAFEQERGRGFSWPIAFCLSGCVLAGSSLLGVIPLAAASAVMVGFGVNGRYRIAKPAWAFIALTVLLLLPLGGFYFWTLSRQAGGARQWNLSFSNLLFAFYELAGFAGLGPGRIALRSGATSSQVLSTCAPYLAGLAALASAYLVLLRRVLVRQKEQTLPATCWMAGATILLSTATMFALAWLARWPFWGRHLAALCPFFVVLTAFGIGFLCKGNLFERSGAFALICLLATSSAFERFSSWHARDDYRSAAAIAERAVSDGQTVWWVADVSAARYYHVPVDLPAVIPIQGEPNGLPDPDLVILSKPDIYDRSGAVSAYLKRNNFKVTRELPAFQIWSR